MRARSTQAAVPPLVLAALGLVAATPAIAQAPDACFGQAEGEPASVDAVIDGATIRLTDGRIVRLAGIEAPQKAAEGKGGESGEVTGGPGEGARRALEALGGDGAVVLHEVGASPDRHGRVHARLVAGGVWVERELVAGGWARARPFPGEAQCFRALLTAESVARQAALGLWRDPGYAVLSADDPSLRSRNGLYELVEGRVTSVGRGAYMTFVDFGYDARADFSVMLTPDLVEALAGAGRLVESLENRRIRVRGIIEESGGPAIRLADPAEIELLD